MYSVATIGEVVPVVVPVAPATAPAVTVTVTLGAVLVVAVSSAAVGALGMWLYNRNSRGRR